MRIVITFDSLEEFDRFRGGEPEIVPVTQAQQATEQIREALAAPEPAPEPEPDPAPKADKPAVRKILADLNKKAGTNKAAELIKAAGYGKLSEVPDDLLPGIADEAQRLMEAM